MDTQWLLIIHGSLTLLVVVSFLCGQWPIFEGTPIQRIHHFLTFGAYDYLLRFVGSVFGEKGANAILSVEYFCCDRPNPVLQIIYLAIIGVTYYLIANSSFSYIPGYYLSGIHRYTSLLAVGIGVLFFLLTSFTDPGTVKAENVYQYQSAYPYDNIIYRERECSTCKIPKHLFLCLYGTIALGLILAGRLKELRIVYILTVYYGIENSFRNLVPHIVQWLLGSYNTQILLMVFLAIVSLLLVGFFGYHANLCRTNTTTNETIKWQDHMNWQRKVNEARASAAALKASINGSSERKPPESKWKAFFRRSRLEDTQAVVTNNIYDKGILHNVWEVIAPPSTRHSFLQTKSKSR